MFYRLSNMTRRGKIEEEFGTPFKFPGIYEPRQVINGLNEETIPLITQDNTEYIQHGIWGILPDGFREDWQLFQNSLNTLNLGLETVNRQDWLRQSLLRRRCLILVNGFFTMYHYEGELYPYYVYYRDKRPFALAGIYSVLDDGFLTASVLVGPSNQMLRQIQNLDAGMPLVLEPGDREHWLEDMDEEKVHDLTEHATKPDLVAHPIARELYNRNICYDSMLEPVFYKNIPIPLF